MGKILLFYKYVDIQYPHQIAKWQQKLCAELNLKGRIILAHEGINATVGGSVENCERYKAIMNKHHLFNNIDFKEGAGSADHFPRMRIVVKKEIVHLGLDTETVKAIDGAPHLQPEETHNLIASKKNLVIIDCRNDYETAIGTFVNAIRPDTKYFRQFPEYVDNNPELFKDKEVLMTCTGGIRCERASAYVKSKGWAKEVYQMEGGIHRYIEQFPEGFFRGKNYVFDARITVKVNADILGTCYLCGNPEDEYTNCMYATCNRHFICCARCLDQHKNTCSSACLTMITEDATKKRPARIKVTEQSIESSHESI